ncbi:hypothetical protein BSKO_08353 [Bryopsis sp. KO-2023]|nr:hypothetical protein BSKO_08353 [Bryopsis sp. KO-2023]
MLGQDGLWVDKHSPRFLDDHTVQTRVAGNLKKLAASDDMPHLLLYGPSGSGKKSLILSLLLAIYGEGVEKVRTISKEHTFQVSGRKVTVPFTHLASNYHVDMNPSAAGLKDRHIIQHFVTELCSQRHANQNFTYFTLVLNEANLLSSDAQSALRSTMEKYSSRCRMIMHCTNLSKVLDPIRSRCLCIRVPPPSQAQIHSVLQEVAVKENITLPEQFSRKIAAQSRGNLKKAILALQVAFAQQYPFAMDQNVPVPEWESYIQEIARDILANPSLGTALSVRGKLYDLLANCIPASTILKRLTFDMLPNFSNNQMVEICGHAATIDHNMATGGKEIMFLESFVLKVMKIRKAQQ